MAKQVGTVHYTSNNSGGSWWLTDQNWKDLEDAGWKVKWYKDEESTFLRGSDPERFLGALASSASKENTTLGEAIRDWEAITGADSTDLGCPCCGTPHYFSLEAPDGSWLDSYSPEYPSRGDAYDDED